LFGGDPRQLVRRAKGRAADPEAMIEIEAIAFVDT
jgi:hypothetical protein